MDELIYKEQALNCFHDWIDKYGDVHTPDEMREYRAIEALPSAEPEVIYCKDCKYVKRFDDQGMLWCNRPLGSGFHVIAVEDTDFCSHAKKEGLARNDND